MYFSMREQEKIKYTVYEKRNNNVNNKLSNTNNNISTTTATIY